MVGNEINIVVCFKPSSLSDSTFMIMASSLSVAMIIVIVSVTHATFNLGRLNSGTVSKTSYAMADVSCSIAVYMGTGLIILALTHLDEINIDSCMGI